MKLLLLTTMLFSFTASSAQTHNDLQEFGFKGQVKRVTTFYYDTLNFDGSNEIYDRQYWRVKTVYAFNKDGNFDTVFISFKIHGLEDTVFSNKTIYTGTGNNRTSVSTDANNKVTGTTKYLWLSDTSYRTTETSVNGKGITISDQIVDKKYRDKGATHTSYDENNKIEFNDKYENVLGDNGLIIKSYRTDLLTNIITTDIYQYIEFDKQGNPVKIFLMNLPDKKVVQIRERTIEYY